MSPQRRNRDKVRLEWTRTDWEKWLKGGKGSQVMSDKSGTNRIWIVVGSKETRRRVCDDDPRGGSVEKEPPEKVMMSKT